MFQRQAEADALCSFRLLRYDPHFAERSASTSKARNLHKITRKQNRLDAPVEADTVFDDMSRISMRSTPDGARIVRFGPRKELRDVP